jgi:two-component system, NtrC family, response regulator AtoC
MNEHRHEASPSQRILVVDDEDQMCLSLKELLENEGFHVDIALSAREAFSHLHGGGRYSLVICDIRMPEMGGISLLSKIGSELPVIMITAYASIDTARRVFKLGARDYLTKPFKFDELLVMVRQYMQRRDEAEPRHDYLLQTLNPRLNKAFELASKFSATDIPILVTGESGAGKEVIADYIYNLHKDSVRSCVKINCAAIPEALLEGELFGYEKGAFTGAVSDKAGKIEEADGGILFLDEIGDMPLALQAKMLRVLQDFQVCRLGCNEPVSVSTHIIAASNQDLEGLVEKGQFRLDLYHRLCGVHLTIPPLRERMEDIESLANFFLGLFNDKYGKAIKGISEEAFAQFRKYPWPGNIRELKYSIERAVVICEGDTLGTEDLADSICDYKASIEPATGTVQELPKAIEEYRNEYMRKLILSALEKTGGNKVEVAKMLNISRKTLYNRMKELNIRHEFS